MVDFKELRGRVTIVEVCEYLDIALKPHGYQFRGKCLICNHKSERAFTVTPHMGRWWCFGRCRGGGDIIELVSKVKKLTPYQAACLLETRFGPS